MPTLANVVVNDATSPTPVAHTFTPQSNDKGITEWRERNGPVVSQPRLVYSFLEKRQAGYTKTSLNLNTPQTAAVTDPVTGVLATKVLANNLVKIETMFSFEMTEQQKCDQITLACNAAKHAILYGSMTKGESVTG